MPDEMMIVERDPVDDMTYAVHPQVDPRLSVPEHLQSISYEEDIWRRMASSPYRHPLTRVGALREDADTRDLLRSAISAASEREKEVLLHNQARVFSTFMYTMARSVGTFLSTPMTPKSWRENSSRDDGKKATAGIDTNSTDGVKGFKALIAFLLTPKVFLTAIAVTFGVVAGFSRIQVFNLNETIKTYEAANTSLKESKDALEGRISDFDTRLDEKNTEIQQKDTELRDLEIEIAELRSEVEGRRGAEAALEEQLRTVRTELQHVQEGNTLTEQQLRSLLADRDAGIIELNSKIHALESDVEQRKQASGQRDQALTSIREERDRMEREIIDLKSELARLEIQLADTKKYETLLTFAERSLNDIRQLAGKYSAIKDEHIMEHINRCDSRKARHGQ